MYHYRIFPVFVLGERLLYSNIQGSWQFRLKLNNYGVPAVLPSGNLFLPILPKRKGLLIVFGKPLDLPHIPHPTSADISHFQEKYMSALSTLYEKYKCEYYGDDYQVREMKLEMW